MNQQTAQDVSIPVGSIQLDGYLSLPADAKAVVIFAHGSGSSRFSARNKYVAKFLNANGLGTLLFDLMTETEQELDMLSYGRMRFDIEFLSDRLVAATAWLIQQASTRTMHVGYFGASTGAAAALMACAQLPRTVGAIVSRGGRPDLAMTALPYVTAPTLLIVGGNDTEVIKMNEVALANLPGIKSMRIVPGASHLFEETGALQEVAQLAVDWFNQYLLWDSQAQESTAS